MSYLKHEGGNNRSGKRAKAAKPKSEPEPVKVILTGPDSSGCTRTPSMQHDINYVRGMDGSEQSLDWIARGLEKLATGEPTMHLYTGDGCLPVKVTLAENINDDTMDRLVTAVERIADSLARLAGLNRPRLESWHEQEEYTPRYKSIACDCSAPGPKQAD